MADHHLKLAICRQKSLVVAFTLLIALGATLASAPGAQAAPKTRGAVLVKNISSSSLTAVGQTLYFVGHDRSHGFELWRSDGTRRGTSMVKDISPGRPGSSPDQLTAVGKTLYFTARDGVHGPELWRSNGTARGTRLVKDLVPGQGAYNLGSFTNVAGTLFFVAASAPQGGTQTGLWRSDGTAAGTTLVKEVGVEFPTAVGSILYFGSEDGLWRSDGTASGTMMVKGFAGNAPCAREVCWPINVAGTLFFTAATDPTHWGLWRSDGTAAGTTLVKPGVAAISRIAVGATLYFATLDYGNSWLWASDGTETGTIPITSVGVSPQGDGPWPQLTYAGGALYFVRNGPGLPLMRGTKVVRSAINPRQLTAVGKTLYFEGYDQKHGNELWRSDSTTRGTRMVRDIRRGARSAGLSNLTAVGKTLFFTAHGSRHSEGLWRAGPKPK